MQVRCLLSRADPAVKRTKVRETQYSVEAISLDGAQSWIGINQCHVTRYTFQVPSHMSANLVNIRRVLPALMQLPDVSVEYARILKDFAIQTHDTWGLCRYIGHYLRAGGLPSICADPAGLRAEQMVSPHCRHPSVHNSALASLSTPCHSTTKA